MTPASGGIDQDHEGNGGAPEDVQGVESRVHFQGFMY
jgi:hypothetical protein